MLDDLKEIIAIDSVSGEPEGNAPFGRGGRQALDWFINKAKSYGLATGECNGYAAWAETGAGEHLTGILGHLDIVPVGEGWSTPPLTLTIDGGRLYGRGVADDKGPFVAALHALKSIKDSGRQLNGRIRLIAGVNEETGCGCMKYYAKHCKIPAVSFTPDSEFPVVCSEKGIMHIKISFKAEKQLEENFLQIGGGARPNVVPSRANCIICGELQKSLAYDPQYLLLQREDIAERLADGGCDFRDFSFLPDDKLNISVTGTAAHGSTPEKGDNALRKLFVLLSAVTDSPSIKFINDYLVPNDAAEKLGIAVSDGQSGALTLNLGIVNFNSGRLEAVIDIRKPLCITFDEIRSRISALLPQGATLEVLTQEPNLYADPASPLVSSLLAVYEKHFHEKGEPLKTGGGTYAKTLPNCIAFGPTPHGQDFRMHNADEFMPVELFFKLKDIYEDAMLALDKRG